MAIAASLIITLIIGYIVVLWHNNNVEDTHIHCILNHLQNIKSREQLSVLIDDWKHMLMHGVKNKDKIAIVQEALRAKLESFAPYKVEPPINVDTPEQISDPSRTH
jgi:hypothetical protein